MNPWTEYNSKGGGTYWVLGTIKSRVRVWDLHNSLPPGGPQQRSRRNLLGTLRSGSGTRTTACHELGLSVRSSTAALFVPILGASCFGPLEEPFTVGNIGNSSWKLDKAEF